jgi:hypothetical protein
VLSADFFCTARPDERCGTTRSDLQEHAFMTKTRKSNRETKKQPAHTFKEKRATKKSNKDAKSTVQPLIVR